MEKREENFDGEVSQIERFIDSECNLHEKLEEKTYVLYASYKQYCLSVNEKYKSMIGFAKAMKNFGIVSEAFSFVERDNGHTTGRFKGIALK